MPKMLVELNIYCQFTIEEFDDLQTVTQCVNEGVEKLQEVGYANVSEGWKIEKFTKLKEKP